MEFCRGFRCLLCGSYIRFFSDYWQNEEGDAGAIRDYLFCSHTALDIIGNEVIDHYQGDVCFCFSSLA